MQIKAVLEALVAEADDSRAGVVGAALGLEDGEDVRVYSLGIIPVGLLLGLFRLPDFVVQELLLQGQRAVCGDRCLDLAERLESELRVFITKRSLRASAPRACALSAPPSNTT